MKLCSLQKRQDQGSFLRDKRDICREGLCSEWVTLKPLISQEYGEVKCKDFLIFLSSDSTLTAMFPNFAQLASIALVIPINIAE